jgi:2-polyprenyl-3-methyl-5-hydroxy-6-metoxy-1,4-benzoquinol methylase
MNRDFNAEARALPIHLFDEAMHTFMMKTFAPHMEGLGPSALELGCFRGSFTKLLRKEFMDVTVVDASEECLHAAREACPDARLVHGRFEDVELDGTYDAIVATHVLEHCEEPITVLNRCRQWLAPHGRLFIAVPNACAPSRQIATAMGLLPSCDAVMDAEAAHGHKRTYDSRLLRVHALGAGLAIHEMGGILFKALSGAQMDQALKTGVITPAYLEGCYQLGKRYPELCSSTYVVCGRRP